MNKLAKQTYSIIKMLTVYTVYTTMHLYNTYCIILYVYNAFI